MRDHSELVRWYGEWEQATETERTLAMRDRDYYDGRQWTDEELETLKKRQQPPITVNRIAPKVNYLSGEEIRIRTDPKAEPRTPMDGDVADVATDAIRYVLDETRFDPTRTYCVRDLLVEGIAGGEVCVAYRNDDVKIQIKRIPWDRLMWDPHAMKADFSDAKYLGIVMWMDRAEVLETWPDAESVVDSTSTVGRSGDSNATHQDKPRTWSDPSRDRIKITQMWWKEPVHQEDDADYKQPEYEWFYATLTGGGFIEEPQISPYLDEDDATECPLVLQACYIDRDNAHYGVVRNWIPIQDEINKRRSKALHLLNQNRSIGDAGAFADLQDLKDEKARADGHIEVPPGANFQIIPNSEMVQQQFQLLEEAKREIDSIGPSALATGHQTTAVSGRSQMVAQQSGQTELEFVFDAARNWQHGIYKLVFNRIVQFWTGNKFVRVRDSDQNVRFVQLNQEVTRRMAILEAADAQGIEVPPELLADPALDEVIEVRHNVAEWNVDIKLTDVPDVASLRHEQFELLVELAKTLPPGTIPPDVIIEASSLRNKQEILERLRGSEEQQAMQAQMQQQQAMQAQQAQEVALAQAQAKTHETMASAEQKKASAQETMVDTHIKAAQAQMGLNLPQRPINEAQL